LSVYFTPHCWVCYEIAAEIAFCDAENECPFQLARKETLHSWVCSLFGAIGMDILDERGWNSTLNLVKVFCARSLLKATNPKKTMEQEIKHL
jgi:hypothetical protein